MSLFSLLLALASVLLPANGYLMPKFVLSSLETNGVLFHDRIDKAYHEWCERFLVAPNDCRRKAFAVNFFRAEAYTNETGQPLKLNEFADMTVGEYRQFQDMKDELSAKKADIQKDKKVEQVKVTPFLSDISAFLGSRLSSVGPVAMIATGDLHLNRGPSVSQGRSQFMQSWIGIRREMQQDLERKIQTWEASFQQSLSTSRLDIAQSIIKIDDEERTRKSYFFQRKLLKRRLKMEQTSKLREKARREYAFHRKLFEYRLKRKRRERSMRKLVNRMNRLVSATTERLNKLTQEGMDTRIKIPEVETNRKRDRFHQQLLSVRLGLEKTAKTNKHLEEQAELLRAMLLDQPRDYADVRNKHMSTVLQIYDAAIRTAVENGDWHGAAVASDLAGEHVLQLDKNANRLRDYASLSKDLYAQAKISNSCRYWSGMEQNKNTVDELKQAIASEVFSDDVLRAAATGIKNTCVNKNARP